MFRQGKQKIVRSLLRVYVLMQTVIQSMHSDCITQLRLDTQPSLTPSFAAIETHTNQSIAVDCPIPCG